ELDRKLRLFLLGTEIDAAEPLTIALELLQLGLDLDERRNGRIRLQRGKREACFRRAIELLADRMRILAPALARRFLPRLGASAVLARLSQPLLHLTQRLLELPQRGLGRSEVVGRLTPLALGLSDGVKQLAAALLDLGGEIGQRGEIGAGFFLAGAER